VPETPEALERVLEEASHLRAEWDSQLAVHTVWAEAHAQAHRALREAQEAHDQAHRAWKDSARHLADVRLSHWRQRDAHPEAQREAWQAVYLGPGPIKEATAEAVIDSAESSR
jgi:hypothetical protein